MSHLIISVTQTDIFEEDFGITLDFEKEFSESDFIGKEDFLQFLISEKYVVFNDDTKPHMPKGIVIYELKSFPNERLVIKDGSIYQSNVGEGNYTSDTWVTEEWDTLVQGA